MIRFGTGGWRAVIGEGFTEENVRKIAGGIARWLDDYNQHKIVFIGYDRRQYSKEAADWLASTLSHSGIDVLLSSTYISSPAAMFAVKSFGLDCGLMVTASHNPPEYNGVKVFIREGRDAPENITRDIEGCIEKVSKPSRQIGVIENISIIDDFRRYIQSRIMVWGSKKLNIAFDVMFGSALQPFAYLAWNCCQRVDVINDGVRPADRQGLPAPDKENIPELLAMMETGEYDIGFAFDGDGDRIGIVDDTGEYISANEAMCIMYWYLHECRKEKGGVVKNICTTERLKAMAESFGENCYDVPVGFKWVSAKMKETYALIGGESSGGMTFRDYLLGKDATLTAMFFIEMLSNTGKKLSTIKKELRDEYAPSVFVVKNIRYNEANKDKIADFCIRDVGFLYKDAKISYPDGAKIMFDNGDFLSVRLSGTEPLIRLMAEAHSEEDALKYINICEDALKNFE